MARHYYDLYCLIKAGVADEAMEDAELFKDVASHRGVFFRQNWVDYSTLVRRELRLVPTDEQMAAWRLDYRNMQNEMFFGAAPDFDSVIKLVRTFQDDFNRVPK